MRASELRDKTVAELNDSLLDLRKEQFNLRVQKAFSQTPRTHQFQQLRRDIARIKTILTEKSRASEA